MKRHVTFAAVLLALAGGMAGVSCTQPQPPLECQVNFPTWGVYTLLDAGPGPSHSCEIYEGDRIDFQKYLPPGEAKPQIAWGTRRVGNIGRTDACTGGFDGYGFRVDPTDPEHLKESPRATFPANYPSADGFCVAEPNIVPAEQSYPAVDAAWCATNAPQIDPARYGPLPRAATRYKEEWSGLRVINTAAFPGTLWEANVVVTRETPGVATSFCQATYKVAGMYPWVGCESNEDCNPDANLDAGRAVGSGFQKVQKPYCKMFRGTSTFEKARWPSSGVCVIADGSPEAGGVTVTLDDLAKVK